MSKITGFMTFAREAPGERSIAERIGDWQPIHLPLPDDRLQTQAARCMDCGIPFCHKGQTLAGMTTGCPINNLIPEWNDLIYRGLWRQAYDRLAKTNNFPEFTGLVCPAPCEAACTLGISDPPVTVKSIEYAIIDRAFDEGWVRPAAPARRTGKRVAVVGSGPAGLACADQLNTVGHEVTVFERADRIGGLLMYGIPNMKLDKALVERRVDVLRAGGVRFITGVSVGEDVTADALRRDFDAVVLCTGSTRPRDLTVPGRELGGVHFAMEFLRGNTRHLLDAGQANGHYLSAAGRDVIVIGGGDTGTDCVATALRHGCRSLVQFEIMPQPPDARAADNPWPMAARLQAGLWPGGGGGRLWRRPAGLQRADDGVAGRRQRLLARAADSGRGLGAWRGWPNKPAPRARQRARMAGADGHPGVGLPGAGGGVAGAIGGDAGRPFECGCALWPLSDGRARRFRRR